MNTSEYFPFLDIFEVTVASKLFIALIALIYMPYFSFEKKKSVFKMFTVLCF